MESVSLDTPPACVLVRVVRPHLFQRPGTNVQSLPVVPSRTLSLHGTEYALVSFVAKTGTPHGGHWTAYADTTTGWYLFDDRRVHPVADIAAIRHGVFFLYEPVGAPRWDVGGGLPNPDLRCWANACAQMLRYAPSTAYLVGRTTRPSFADLVATTVLGAT